MIDRDDDPELDDLMRALRATTLGAPPSTVASTRARVVASARRRSAGPSWALAAAALLAIVLGGSTVWAFFTGRLPFGADGAPAGLERGEPQGAVDRTPAPTRVPEPSVPEPSVPEPSVPEALAPEVLAPETLAPEAPAPEAVAPEVAPSPRRREAVRPIDPAERRAYDAAHALHFGAGDWPAAIDAWDAYLASFPRGRFGLEARYNRALALVRAGRVDEARVALTPFAEARFGAYRRTEARALLEALGPETAP